MLNLRDQEILQSMASREGPAPKELFQAARDAELKNQRFTKADVDNFERYEAHMDVRNAVRKDLLPLEVEGLLARDYDAYMASGAADITWVRSY